MLIFKRISSKIVFAVFAVVLFPLLISSFFFIEQLKGVLLHEANYRLEHFAEDKVADLEAFVQQHKKEIVSYSVLPGVVRAAKSLTTSYSKNGFNSSSYQKVSQEYGPTFSNYRDAYQFYDILLISLTGDVVYSVAEEADLNTNILTGRFNQTELVRVFSQALNSTGPVLSEISYYQPSSQNLFFLALPIVRADKQVAVIVFKFRTYDIYNLVLNTADLGQTGEVIVVQRAGKSRLVIAPLKHKLDAAFAQKISLEEEAVIKKGIGGEIRTIGFIDYRGKHVLGIYAGVPSFNWDMIIKVDQDEVLARLNQLKIMVAMSLLALTVFVLLMARSIAKVVCSPIRRLDKSMQLIGKDGAFNHVQVEGQDEIASLAYSFNQMVDQLESKQKNINQQVNELKLAKTSVQAIIDNSAEGIITIDGHGIIQTFNHKAEEMFGYQSNEVIGSALNHLIPKIKELLDRQGLFNSSLCNKTLMPTGLVEFEARKKDCTVFPVELNFSRMFIIGKSNYVVLIRDISRRKQNEKEIKKAQLDLATLNECNEAIVHSVNEQELLNEVCKIIVETDRQHFVWVGYAQNDQEKTILPMAYYGFEQGYLQKKKISWNDDVYGNGPAGRCIRQGKVKVVDDIKSDPDFKPWRAHALKKGYKSVAAFPLSNGDKTFGVVVIYSTRERDFSPHSIIDLQRLVNNLAHGILTLREKNARQQAERELVIAKESAEQASQAKSKFLSSMSHELRTPLNAIIGFGQLLESDFDTSFDTEQKEFLHQIMKASKHLLALVDDVLDFTKIETGLVNFTFENIKLQKLFQESKALVQSIAKEKNIQINFPADINEDSIVYADYKRTQQVLINLLSNAIKYNQKNGHIDVSCSLQPDRNLLKISIADTGRGIPQDRRHELFKPFNRLGAENSDVGGTGIGLIICKDLIGKMNGHIGYEPNLNCGSVFWVELPLTAPGSEFTTENDRFISNEKLSTEITGQVLYIEDNPASYRLLEMVLSRFKGIELIGARTAEQGIELAKKNLPDVIILDISLPGMSGVEALYRLREIDETKNIPAIALTAATTEENIAQGLEAGFKQYLTKPMQINEMMDSLNQVLNIEKGYI